MKATDAKLPDFLQKSPQFVIPIYQRTYSWTAVQCRQWWDDILRAGSSDASADILAMEKEAEGLLDGLLKVRAKA